MTTIGEANKERNREIAQNEEAKQAAGSARVSLSAIALAAIVLGTLLTLGWLALR